MIYPAFSILHISDLHKDADASYDQLLASLEDDRVIWRNGNPTILEPSFIVVSGDLIQGGSTNDEIASQYGTVIHCCQW